jgi:hypothetical protein
METIRTYLENMFLSLPRTKDVLKAKEELLSMMEDKYSELKSEGKSENEAVGIVIAEFGNLQELADELGIEETLKKMDEQPVRNVLGINTVRDFIDNRVKASIRIGAGVLLCIWAPILLIIAGSMENTGYFRNWPNGQDGAIAAGLVALFVMVATAVGLFIMSGALMGRYQLDKDGDFRLDFDALNYVRNEEDRYRMNFAARITIGVVTCIFSVIPIIILGIMDFGDLYLGLGVGLLLLLVGGAVFLFITAGMQSGAYQILLKKGEYSEGARERNQQAERIGAFYWPIIVLIYLLWSFLTGRWYITWIIWPIAGLLFAAITGFAGYLSRDRENRPYR